MNKMLTVLLALFFTTNVSYADETFYKLDIPLEEEFQQKLWDRCNYFNVDYSLALAVMHKETGGTFNTQLISVTNDYGLFQINKVHHKWLSQAGYTNMLNPVHNIDAGLMILKDSLERTNTKEQGLVMYNQGSGSAKRSFANGVYSTKYSRGVLQLEKEYKEKMEDMVQIKFKEITEGCMPIITPDNKGDAIDLVAADNYYLKKGDFEKIKLGVAMEVPEEYCTLMLPRSSTFVKYNVLQANSIGLIDNSYNGDEDELMMPVIAFEDTFITKGTRICQILCIPRHDYRVEQVESLSNKNRGGFGTTGTVTFV